MIALKTGAFKNKHMGKFSAVALFVAFFLLSGIASAIPQYISLQGRLQNSTGDNQDGSFMMNFSIYDAVTGGNLLWNETQNVSVSGGLFDVELGNVTALNLAFDKSYWVEINVSGELMTPRMRVTSSAYAYRANETDYFGGQASTYYLNTTGESSLNVNSSEFWDNMDVPSDLNYLINLSENNITDENWIENSQESSLNVNSSDYWDNIDTPAGLNYKINLSENNITDENWIENSQESLLNVNSSDYLDNYDSSDFILAANEGNLNVNSSQYLGNYLWSDYLLLSGGIMTGTLDFANFPFTITSTSQIANLNASYAGIAYDLSCTDCISGTEIAVLTDADLSDDITANFTKSLTKTSPTQT
jgi:hypothetical protein